MGNEASFVGYMQLAFNLAPFFSLAIFVALLGALIYAIRPYKNYERGMATLVWAFPASVPATMVLLYLDTPYIFLSLFGGPGFSALLLPPEKSGIWRVLGGILLALSGFITLATSGVIKL